MATPPDFTAGAILTAAQMNQVGLWLVKTQVVGAGVANVTVTAAFSADFDAYKIIYTGGVMSGQQRFGLQLGASTTGYYEGLTTVTYSTGAAGAAATNNGASWILIGGGNTASASFNVELQDPYKAAYTQMQSAGSLQTAQSVTNSGIHTVASSFTDFKITPQGAATMTGGTIRVYGYRN
jgi:hypothetical protein